MSEQEPMSTDDVYIEVFGEPFRVAVPYHTEPRWIRSAVLANLGAVHELVSAKLKELGAEIEAIAIDKMLEQAARLITEIAGSIPRARSDRYPERTDSVSMVTGVLLFADHDKLDKLIELLRTLERRYGSDYGQRVAEAVRAIVAPEADVVSEL